MSLITDYGRIDRAAIMDRARAILKRKHCTWQEAVTAAYVEADVEKRGKVFQFPDEPTDRSNWPYAKRMAQARAMGGTADYLSRQDSERQ
jgi:hypothetical protein